MLDPQTLELRFVPSARRGAVPQDWSADRKRLLYAQDVNGYPQLFEFDTESEEVRPITHGPDVHPEGCYSSNGRFAYMHVAVENDGVVSRIALTDRGGSRPVAISQGPRHHGPTCAPDGSAVVYVATDERGRESLEVISLAEPYAARRLGPGRDPRFSADSRWIVYSAPVGRTSEWRLRRIRPDGSGRKALGRSTLSESRPTLSSDGRLVLTDYVTIIDS